MATALTGAYSEIFESRQSRLFYQVYSQNPESFRDVAKMETSSKAYEDRFRFAGLGSFATKHEGAPIHYDVPVQGQVYRITHGTYALGFRITHEAKADAQYPVFDRMNQELAMSAVDHRENLFWGVLNDSFNGNIHTGLDGLSLINTAHPLLKFPSTTVSNELTPPTPLSTTALEEMTTVLRDTVSEENRKIGNALQPKWLIVPNELEWQAVTILETEAGRPGTSDHDLNTMSTSRMGIRKVQSTYLTAAKAFWLVAGRDTEYITWYDREPVSTDSSKDSQTKDTMIDAMYRASVAINGWRPYVGSNPS